MVVNQAASFRLKPNWKARVVTQNLHPSLIQRPGGRQVHSHGYYRRQSMPNQLFWIAARHTAPYRQRRLFILHSEAALRGVVGVGEQQVFK